MAQNVLLEIKDLSKWFVIRKGILSKVSGYIKAVNDVNFIVNKGETLGIVGESGCGKSTLGRTILKLINPTKGEIIFNGINITNMTREQIKPLRKDMQIIFQDPYSSLNPRKTVGEIIAEPMNAQKIGTKEYIHEKTIDIMKECGLNTEYIRRYPHEFSGGQRQRIGIARAISINPKFVICDEPVSALDVSIQAQIINLMKNLQEKYNMTYIFISHDLKVVKHICNRVLVMYLGQVVEIADKTKLYNNPSHPYTQALLSAIPIAGKETKNKIILNGDLPSPANLPKGCYFHTRCPKARSLCKENTPKLKEISPGHFCTCDFI